MNNGVVKTASANNVFYANTSEITIGVFDTTFTFTQNLTKDGIREKIGSRIIILSPEHAKVFAQALNYHIRIADEKALIEKGKL